ncbi:GatB/YqeY domain-containing protein [Metallumcola ferriviriculae]|uniref:GatB/YqeY domain-containing protein n=1 Tax=Metallumcola ferriviriculae TaxID=3039180 RepID=A0AAU0UL00_9FIRM|nr:GatB/YqeY domain-containing protein [Desulfitibacteraceae bacterium MK1]
MSLREKLVADVKIAMKARQAGKLELTTLRMVMAAIKNKEIDAKVEISDDDIIEIIVKGIKMRQESLVEYEKADREDQVEQLHQEIAILKRYLPEQLGEGEVRRLAEETIEAVGAQGPKDMGKVMGAMMPKVKGKADGKLVNKIVQELLS